MLYLDKRRLEALLRLKNLSIAGFAEKCGVSRQSIYNMFSKNSVFNTSFEKMISYLGISYEDITENVDVAEFAVQDFPDKIKKIIVTLLSFAQKNHADLILFGSRAAGKKSIRHDFDFAVYFHKKSNDRAFGVLRQSLVERSFPYRIDLVNLNNAPEWFRKSIEEGAIYLRKEDEK